METANPTSEPGAVGSGSESPSGSTRPPSTLDWEALDDQQKISRIYSQKCLDAEQALPKVLPRVWEYCQKHIAAGRTWRNFYPYKLLELWEILITTHPTNILELGAGCTTAVFAHYAESEWILADHCVSVVTIDENVEWLAAVYTDVGSDRIRSSYCPALQGKIEDGRTVIKYSNMPSDWNFQLVYVDGPMNNKNGTPLICVDCIPLMRTSHVPNVVFDIRRETVSYAMEQTVGDYHWSLSAWQEQDVPWYLSGFRHHTVARRKA